MNSRSSSSSLEVERKRPAQKQVNNQKKEDVIPIRKEPISEDKDVKSNLTNEKKRSREGSEDRKDDYYNKQRGNNSKNDLARTDDFRDSRNKDKKEDRRDKYHTSDRRDDKRRTDRDQHYRRRSRSRSRERNNKREDYNERQGKREKKYYRAELESSDSEGRSKKRDNDENKSLRDPNKKQNSEDMYGKQYESNNKEGKKVKEEENIIKELPCWTPSGILAQFQNHLNGTTLKFTKPMDSANPKQKWSLYPFKKDEKYDKISLKGDSAFLIGKDERVAFVLCENPTVSSQHAVIQFREIKKMDYTTNQYLSEIRPYIMDLDSTNGTYLNGDKIESAKYIQLLDKDVLKFGLSQREYVLMLEK